MSITNQQNFQAETVQKQEHSIGSLLLGGLLGGFNEAADMALDTAEAVGEIRAERFQTNAKKAANNNVSLGMKNVLNSSFQPSAEGMELQRIQPQTRYLNYDYGYQRKRGMTMGMAA